MTDAEAGVITGRWWVPNLRRFSKFGTLHLPDNQQGWPELRLHGRLAKVPYERYPVLFGETATGEEFTLLDSRQTGGGETSRRSKSHLRETIRPGTVLRDGLIARPDTKIWREATCGFTNLRAWGFEDAFATELIDERSALGFARVVGLADKEPITIKLPIGTITIWHGSRDWGGSFDDFHVSRITRITFRSKNKIAFHQFDELFVTPMIAFLTFAMDARIAVEDLSVSGDKVDRYGALSIPRALDVIYPVRGRSPVDRSWYEMLLPLGALGGRCVEVVQRWFDLYASRRRALDLFTSVVAADQMFLETRFLLLSQAAEVYHRQTWTDGVIPDHEHATRLATVRDAVPTEHLEWLNGRLHHSNEPSLAARLGSLLDYSNLQGRGVTRRKFARAVADTRNFQTHFDPTLEKRAASDADMYWLSEEIRAVLVGCFLHDLGFEAEEAWERIRQTDLGRGLMYRDAQS